MFSKIKYLLIDFHFMNVNIENIKPGTMVLTYNEKLKKNEYNKVKTLLTDKNMYEYIYYLTVEGHEIEVAQQHSFYIKNENGIDWIKARLLKVGDSVMFRGNNETLSGEGVNSTKCRLQGKVAASGDITSLLNGVGGDIPIPRRCFAMFFFQESALTTAPNLPSTTLSDSCYLGMFIYCTSLTSAPALPATTLAPYCYHQLFNNCTSLTTAPELPATTLATNCYYQMFQDCTSLTTAPALPATTLADSCYKEMFYGCTQLNSVKVALSSIPWDDDNYRFPYTTNWLSGVAETGTFKWNGPVPYNGTRNTSLIPSGWTVESL